MTGLLVTAPRSAVTHRVVDEQSGRTVCGELRDDWTIPRDQEHARKMWWARVWCPTCDPRVIGMLTCE